MVVSVTLLMSHIRLLPTPYRGSSRRCHLLTRSVVLMNTDTESVGLGFEPRLKTTYPEVFGGFIPPPANSGACFIKQATTCLSKCFP